MIVVRKLPKNTVGSVSWLDVLLALSEGRAVSGYAIAALRGFEPEYQLDLSNVFHASDQGPTMPLILTASKLAAEIENDNDGDTLVAAEWFADGIQFHQRLAGAVELGEKPDECLRIFAWKLGMLADFAAGLRAVAGGV